VVHALLCFLAAFLSFTLEPLLGKSLTPWLGGGAQVWMGCMVFFQVALLAGYAYAHLLSRCASPRVQLRVHLALVLSSLLLAATLAWARGTPFLPLRTWLPSETLQRPWFLFRTLGTSIGLPFLLLSATSPLVQAWRSSERGVYRLYAWSNAGSLAALLAYPLLAEPLLAMRTQAWGALALLAAYALGLAALLRSAPTEPVPAPESTEAAPPAPWLAWTALATGGSFLFMTATHELAFELSSVPLLWVLPLGLYLLTFIVVFDARWNLARPHLVSLLLGGLALATLLGAGLTPAQHLRLLVSVSLCVASGCTLFHGHLFHLRPTAPRSITAFYFFLAAGGCLGGILAALVAPLCFSRVLEYPLALGAAGLSGLFWLRSLGRRPWAALLQLGAGTVALVAVGLVPGTFTRDVFGPQRVVPMGAVKGLFDGNTLHGIQLSGPEAGVPQTYYHPRSALGLAFQSLRARGVHLRIGLVGLGAGSAAAYARPGDVLRIYEISPKVIASSGKGGRDFSFVGHCGAEVTEIPGDGRWSLAREGSQGFDLLLIDAFSGGNIPWHLLTREAVHTFLAHLAPGGILALHVTNSLPVARLAFGTAGRLPVWALGLSTPGPGSPLKLGPWESYSEYVLVSRDRSLVDDPLLAQAAAVACGPDLPKGLRARARLGAKVISEAPDWTDERNALLDLILRR
jgi:hypothetical protein